MKKTSNKKLVDFSDVHMDMIKELKGRTGINSLTAIIKNALVQYHKGWFPAYASGSSPTSPTTPEDIAKQAEQKAIMKKAQKDAAENLLFKPQIDICLNTLGGEIEIDELGFKYCRFTSYGRDASGDATQKVPLKLVDPIYEQTMLFSPSKKAVLAKRPELADKFK